MRRCRGDARLRQLQQQTVESAIRGRCTCSKSTANFRLRVVMPVRSGGCRDLRPDRPSNGSGRSGRVDSLSAPRAFRGGPFRTLPLAGKLRYEIGYFMIIAKTWADHLPGRSAASSKSFRMSRLGRVASRQICRSSAMRLKAAGMPTLRLGISTMSKDFDSDIRAHRSSRRPEARDGEIDR